MKIPLRGGARPATGAFGMPLILLLAAGLLASACSAALVSPTPLASGPLASGVAASGTPGPTTMLSPTPLPTPAYTNEPDPELAALIPTELAGVAVQVPPVDEFGYTPGDIGEAYGDLGVRFETLQVAYVPRPRSLSLYAVRVAPPSVTTEELEPYLATAGRYVGINGLHREPWELKTIDGRVVWVRPEDNATVLGTMIYTWASGEYLFLMIGVDDTLNRAMFAALPGEAAPTPSPRPSRSPRSSASPQPTESSAPS